MVDTKFFIIENNSTIITNYQITRRNGNTVIDPVAILGFNLGTRVPVRSVNKYDSSLLNYHDLSEFFDILGRRNNFR